jgi:Fe-S-cluster containining protein
LTEEGVHSGLALFPGETDLFPSNVVFPFRGVGGKPQNGEFKIVMFQLGANTCPHLDTEMTEVRCRIYEDRPLICRCFPFHPISSLDGDVIAITDQDCRFVQLSQGKNESTTSVSKDLDIEDPATETACLELISRMKPIARGTVWVLDLESKTWRVSPISRL